MPPTTPNINLTVTLQDIEGAPVLKGSLVITLCAFGNVLPRIAGTSMLAKVGPIKYVLQDGTADSGIPIYGNDQITPPGTYYAVSIVDDKQNTVQAGIYQFTGSGNIDLSNAPQIPPGPGGGTVPPLQYTTADLFGISSSTTTQKPMTLDALATAMNWSVNHPVPPLPAQGQSLMAPPGYSYTLTRTPYAGALIGLYYNGTLQLPGINYTLSNRTIGLMFYTQNGDNLYALYVATTLT